MEQDEVRSRTQEWLAAPLGGAVEPKTMRDIVSDSRLEDPRSRAAASRRVRGSAE